LLANPLDGLDPTGKATWVTSIIVCELSDEASGLYKNDYPIDCFMECEYYCYRYRQYAEGDNTRPRRLLPTIPPDDWGILPDNTTIRDVDVEHCGSCSSSPPAPHDLCPRFNNFPQTPWILIEPDLDLA
jgi:hypothetical protein